MTHLAGLHQIRHGAHRFLDGDLRIDAMLVVKINMVDAETFETGIAGCTHIRRCSTDAEGRAVGSAHDAELGGQHDLVAPRFQHLSEQAFVGTDPVHVGGVEEVDADIERSIEHVEVRGFVRWAIKVRHAHAAEADGGDLEAPELAAGNCDAHGGCSWRDDSGVMLAPPPSRGYIITAQFLPNPASSTIQGIATRGARLP